MENSVLIICIKIPEKNSDLYELNRWYNALYIPGLGLDKSKGYWINDGIIYGPVSNKEFLTKEEFREYQLNKIL